MPTYEYECEKCGHQFELFQRMTAEPIKDCPKCKAKNTVRRLVSGGAGFIFKGSGFYATDYRNSAYKEAIKKENQDRSSTTATNKKENQATATNKTDAKPKKETPITKD